MGVSLRSHKKALGILIGILVVLGIATYSYVGKHGIFSGLQNDLKAIDPGVEFSYTDLEGNPVNLTAFKGKPLIINSWATWMPFSQAELPLLAKIKEEKGDSINVLAINRMEDKAVIKSYINVFSIPNTIIFLVDPTDNYYKVTGGYSMPETIFYNADGVIVSHKRGNMTEEEFRSLVDQITSNK